MRFSSVKIEVLLPEDIIIPLRNRLNDAGILQVGHYDLFCPTHIQKATGGH
ncbi:hypothetical protein [Jeotgalibacillus aurantiacus]|uniref:hypothetical protein n=1 Tax=Jeotgalibacillus aurantiacus TaxID=2763266 RepID=UPI001D0BA6C6|nr:hypothetical protein [Jeotgalibacillus aurantiacus]